MSETDPRCLRCGHDVFDDIGCARCGFAVDVDDRAAARAERLLQFTLRTIAADPDPLARLQALTAALPAPPATTGTGSTEAPPTATARAAAAAATAEHAAAQAPSTSTPAAGRSGAAPTPITGLGARPTAPSSTSSTSSTSTSSTTAVPEGAVPVERPTVLRPESEAERSWRAAKAAAEASRAAPSSASQPPRTSSPSKPPPPPFDPAAARKQLEQRLEFGGWLVGALFAVGGSLWATNLFWGDIPAALRPAVVGGGLALFAAAFLAVGAFLGARHPGSSAGAVLGVVGRLIGVAAAVPLGFLWREVGVVAVVVDLAIAALLWGALRFAARRQGATQSTSTTATSSTTATTSRNDALWFAGGFVLAALAPATPLLAFVVGAAAVALLRGAAAHRAGRAYVGDRSVWVDDVGAVGLAALAVVVDARALGGDSAAAFLLVAALTDTLGRLVEQRPGVFALRGLVRLSCAFVVVVCAIGAIDDAGGFTDYGDGRALAFVCAGLTCFIAGSAFLTPRLLHLPSFFSGGFFAGAAVSAAYVVRGGAAALGLERVGVLLAVCAGIVALWASTHTARRSGGRPLGEAVVTAMLFAWAIVASFAAGEGAWAVPGLALTLALWASDRRAERSVLWALVPTTLLAVVVYSAVDDVAHDVARNLSVGAVCAWLLVAVLLRQVRRAWPLVAATSAAIVFLTAVGGAATLIASEGTLDRAVLATAALCALTLVVAGERSRAVDVFVVGFFGVVAVGCVFVVDVFVDVHAVTVVAGAAVALALVSFLPALPAPSTRLLVRRLTVFARSPRARALAAVIVSAVLVVGVAVVGVAARCLSEAPFSLALAAVAAVLLALRSADRRVVAGAVALGVGAVGDVAVAGFGGGAAAGFVVDVFVLAVVGAIVVAAAGIAVARGRGATLPRVRRLMRRRGPRVPAHEPAFLVVALLLAGVSACGVLAIAGALGSHTATRLTELTALGAGVGLACAALFATRPLSFFAASTTALLAGAPLPLIARGLIEEREPLALGAALAGVFVLAVALVVARALYRPRRDHVPWFLVAWPTPTTLRAAAYPLLLGGAAAVFLIAAGFRAVGDEALAQRFGPGVAIVAVVGAVVGLAVVWRKHRAPVAVGVAFALVAAAGGSVDMIGHATGFMPPSHGGGEAAGALALVGATLVFLRRRGRALLIALSLGLPRRVRVLAVPVVTGGVVVLAALAIVLAAAHPPRLFGPELLFAGVALAALGFAHPRRALSAVSGVGIVVVAAALVALLQPNALTEEVAPTLCLAMMGAALAVQLSAQRIWRSAGLRAFHDDVDDDARASLAAALRGSVESCALLVLFILVALSLSSTTPSTAALASTWIAMGLAVVLFSRVAVAHEQTAVAAMAQGIALAVYVDLRRRTPWLDDIGGVDALALVAAAVVFFALRAVAKRRAGGSGAVIARAAELYAVTLPLLASTLSPNAGGRALVLVVGGALYAGLARSRKSMGYEFLAGGALVGACLFGLLHQGVDAPEAYLFPIAVVGTFLGRRHRRALGRLGRSLAVLSHVPLYVSVAWSALRSESFGSFAVAVVVAALGVVYAIRAKDRRALYAGVAAAFVLVGGRLLLLGLDNAVLGTLLLVGLGVALLAGMTVFTIRRDAAQSAWQKASSRMSDWDE
jgi:hypothetical protein